MWKSTDRLCARMRLAWPVIAMNYKQGCRLSLVCVVSTLPACTLSVGGRGQDKKPVPKFDDYAVTETWQGPAPPVQLISRSEHLFRTQLKEAAQKPPDFAGHYRFAIWGCGTRCVGGALIDLKTGKVFQPPLAHQKRGEEHWIFCTDWDKSKNAEYRSKSRLFVFCCAEMTRYFVWENGAFTEIAHSP